jgi:pyruvate dehydrogenase E2 component (dihydrolipoamide acetyltransferase)
MTDVLMPALSPTMEEGTLSKWHVKEGDTVASGDVIAEIETDKATMEVEAVDEGVVEKILVPEGAEGVKVNTPIARLKGEGEAADAPKPAETKTPTKGASSDDPRAARDQGQDAAHAAAAAPPQSRSSSSGRPEAGHGGDSSLRGGASKGAAADVARSSPSGGGGREADGRGAGGRIFASPLARRLAEQKGVDLAGLKGSGPRGRIVAADIDAAEPGSAPAKAAPSKAAAAPAPEARAPAEPAKVASLESLGIAPGSYDLKPLDGMRRTVARRLTEAFRDIPHFPLSIDIEIDRLLEARARINKALDSRNVRVSVNDILIKASAMALKAVPDANASFTPEGIAYHHHADVAVAVAIEGGLITPIVREAENRTLADISAAMKDLAGRARERKLKPEEYQGGTFSLSNLGMFGIKTFSSIINAPQGMILSVGAGEKRPVVHGDQLAVATVMSVTLTCDHRVVDGAIGASWVQSFRAFVEDPVTMLA